MILHLPDGRTVEGKSAPITFALRDSKPGDVVYVHNRKLVLWGELPSGALLIIDGVVQADGRIKHHRVETGQRKP